MTKELHEDLQILADALKPFEGTTLAVTGATGLIGSLLLKAIVVHNENCEADKIIHGVGFARNPQKIISVFENTTGLRFAYQDISEPIEQFPCDYIVHTANTTSSKTFITNPVEVIDSIVLGSQAVLRFAREANVKGMVYLSSMEVYGAVTAETRASEEQFGNINLQSVRSCYSEGKRLVECMCACYAEEYGVPVRIARLAQTFGAGIHPEENRVFAQFARSVKQGEDIVLHTAGQSFGNYVYTRDAIKAILLLLRQGENGAAYNVVNESTTMTIAEMAQLVAEHFSCGKSRVVFDIPESNTFGYAPGTKLHLSGEKLRKLGWQPEVDLTEMYQRMLSDIAAE